MGGITLDFDSPGTATVYIDDIAFKTTAQIPTPVNQSPPVTAAAPQAYPRAMWVWSTAELLKDATARETLFAFCKQENINQLWIQALYRMEPDVDLSRVAELGRLPEGLQCVMEQADAVRRFLGQAHSHHVTVHALDGYPEFAQQMYHGMPLALVDAIIAFNKQSPPSQRFDGIHFDNEPLPHCRITRLCSQQGNS